MPSLVVRLIIWFCTWSRSADLADQGLVSRYMRTWPGESNAYWRVDLYSLITGAVVLSLAECVYFNPFDKWLPSTHFVIGNYVNTHAWSTHHLPILSAVLAARVVVFWEKLVYSSTLIIL